MGDIKITDLHKIHETDEVKDKYQIFHTEDGRVLQSMVLDKEEVRQLYKELNNILEPSEYEKWLYERERIGQE